VAQSNCAIFVKSFTGQVFLQKDIFLLVILKDFLAFKLLCHEAFTSVVLGAV
jgi:hypothetical protein